MHQYHSFSNNWTKCARKILEKILIFSCENLKLGTYFAEKITQKAKNLHDGQSRKILTLYHCTCLKHNHQHYFLDEDFSWSELGLAGPSPSVWVLHALAFHWIPITALGAVILRWSPEASVATSRAARRGRDARPALVDHLKNLVTGGSTLTYRGSQKKRTFRMMLAQSPFAGTPCVWRLVISY